MKCGENLMIQRNHDRGTFWWTAICDNCGFLLDVEGQDFRMAVAAAKSAGWKVRKAGEQWQHICPDCTAAAAMNSASTWADVRPSAAAIAAIFGEFR